MWGKCLDCPSCPQKSYHLTPKYLNYAFWDRFAMSPKYPILFFPSLSKPSCCWCCSVVKSCLTLGDPRDCGMPGSLFLIIFQSLPKFMFNELLIPSNHLILCHPLLFLPSILPSIRVFSSSHQVAKVLELHLQHQSFQRAPRADILEDWFHHPAFQGTLECLLQDHGSKASILLFSAFFMVQLSHPHMTTGKTIALTTWTFVGKVVSLLFNQVRPSKIMVKFYHQRIYWITFCGSQLYTEWLKLIWTTNKLSSDIYYWVNQI